MRKESGIVSFLPLVVIAIALIGVVGYFSVNRIKGDTQTSVLSKSDENESGSSGSDSNSDDVSDPENTSSNEDKSSETETNETESESEFEVEDKGLDSVGDLKFEIPEIETESEIESSLLQKGTLNEVKSTETLGGEVSGIVKVKGKRNLKFLGLIPVKANVSVEVNSKTGEEIKITQEDALIKLLSFLFSE